MQAKWYKHLNCVLVRFSYSLHLFCRVQARVSASSCWCVRFSHAYLTTTFVSPSLRRHGVIQLSAVLQEAEIHIGDQWANSKRQQHQARLPLHHLEPAQVVGTCLCLQTGSYSKLFPDKKFQVLEARLGTTPGNRQILSVMQSCSHFRGMFIDVILDAGLVSRRHRVSPCQIRWIRLICFWPLKFYTLTNILFGTPCLKSIIPRLNFAVAGRRSIWLNHQRFVLHTYWISTAIVYVHNK